MPEELKIREDCPVEIRRALECVKDIDDTLQVAIKNQWKLRCGMISEDDFLETMEKLNEKNIILSYLIKQIK